MLASNISAILSLWTFFFSSSCFSGVKTQQCDAVESVLKSKYFHLVMIFFSGTHGRIERERNTRWRYHRLEGCLLNVIYSDSKRKKWDLFSFSLSPWEAAALVCCLAAFLLIPSEMVKKSTCNQHSQTLMLNLCLILTIKLLSLPQNGNFCTNNFRINRRCLVVTYL